VLSQPASSSSSADHRAFSLEVLEGFWILPETTVGAEPELSGRRAKHGLYCLETSNTDLRKPVPRSVQEFCMPLP
jgi:hypothetical protein